MLGLAGSVARQLLVFPTAFRQPGRGVFRELRFGLAVGVASDAIDQNRRVNPGEDDRNEFSFRRLPLGLPRVDRPELLIEDLLRPRRGI